MVWYIILVKVAMNYISTQNIAYRMILLKQNSKLNFKNVKYFELLAKNIFTKGVINGKVSLPWLS